MNEKNLKGRHCMMRSSNPALSQKNFSNFGAVRSENAMTIQGTVNKTALMLILVIATASYTWGLGRSENQAQVIPWIMGGLFGGLAMALLTIFKKQWAAVTAPLYALLEGLFLGGISAYYETTFQGIVVQAVFLTFGTLFALLLAYSSGLIKVTKNFRLGIVAATGGIALVYLASFVLGFFGISIPFIHTSGIIGIGFSVFVVIIAALNLVLDFDFIEHGAEQGAPKFMEWYAAFGLMVTLVWLYLEILRLLSKVRSR
jgi:uncharacterized YccA/Bax inhibitor family protein